MPTLAPSKKRSQKLEAEADNIAEKLKSKAWRMANLYKIIDKKKQIRRFTPNEAQQKFYLARHTRNFVPKARKRGMSTAIVLDYFDDCVWAPRTRPIHAAHVDYRDDDAKEKLNMARLAWKQGPLDENPLIAEIWKTRQALNPLVADNKGELVWANGSKQQASTSFMGGTPNRLHLSEFGPLSNDFPDRAQGIVRHTLPSVPADSIVDIETTTEGGTFGECAKIFKEAQDMDGQELTRLHWRLHFVSWLDDPEYRLAGEMPREPETAKYFAELYASDNLIVTPDRQAWWEIEKRTQRANMYTQYPSVVRECWYAGAGVNFFEADGLIWQKSQIVPIQREIEHGDIVIQNLTRPEDRSAEWKPDRLTRKAKENCQFRIWEHPIADRRYVLFADCCVGKMAVGSDDEKRDSHSYGVIREEYIDAAGTRHLPAIVAMCLHGDKCINDQFIMRVVALSIYYGDCLVAPETNNKDKIEERMMKIKVEIPGRPGEYKEVVGVRNMLANGAMGADGTSAGNTSHMVQVWGHLTTTTAEGGGTRGQVLDNMLKLTLENRWICVFEEVLQEMSTFIVNKKGKPEAAPGTHDDFVMGPAIGLFYLPRATRFVAKEEKMANEYRASWVAQQWDVNGI